MPTGRTPHNQRVKEGYRSGRLMVVQMLGISKTKTRPIRMCKCVCDCGAVKVLASSDLAGSYATKSCGCLGKESQANKRKHTAESLVGRRFNNYVITGYFYKGKRTYFQYLCDCGQSGQMHMHPAALPLKLGCGCTRKGTLRRVRSKNLTGQRFGRLLVLGTTGKADSHGELGWLVRCDCGIFKTIAGHRLRTKTRSCGCLRYERFRGAKSIAGQRFGSLCVLGAVDGGDTDGSIRWLTKCDCGIVTILNGSRLRKGQESCGCLKGRARWYPDSSAEEFRDLMRAKQVWKGLLEHVRQQRNEHETESPKTDAALSA